jgi:hypothetical protein
MRRDALIFHLLFAAVAAAALYLAPPVYYGWTVLGLVVGWHVALLLTAMLRGHGEWIYLWSFLLPLSLLQVVPDWILADFVGSLRFPDHGVPRIGSVPVYMAGMWAIPLFLVLHFADALSGRLLRAAAAMVLALLVFASAEWYAAPLGLWQAVNVTQAPYGVALYVLPAEALLGLAAWWAYHATQWSNILTRSLVAAGISVFYTGALVMGWFFVELGASI